MGGLRKGYLTTLYFFFFSRCDECATPFPPHSPLPTPHSPPPAAALDADYRTVWTAATEPPLDFTVRSPDLPPRAWIEQARLFQHCVALYLHHATFIHHFDIGEVIVTTSTNQLLVPFLHRYLYVALLKKK